ncbi:MAG: hypothetical protein Q8P20_10450 [bacterium]|nr:hypothetical protein [bacterium]
MVEQGTPVDPRIMPGIDGKDKITNPFAISIRDIKRKLGLRFLHLPQESGSLSAEGRLLANAGVLINDFRSRFYDDDANIQRRTSDQEWRLKQINERNFVDKKNEIKIRDAYKEQKEEDDFYEKLSKGKLKTRKEIETFIREQQQRILFSLRIIPEVEEIFRHDSNPTLTIEELIALSVIHKGQKQEVIEKALSYLMHSDGLGGLVLEQLKEYLLHIDRGYLSAVFIDKHATPLRNGDV